MQFRFISFHFKLIIFHLSFSFKIYKVTPTSKKSKSKLKLSKIKPLFPISKNIIHFIDQVSSKEVTSRKIYFKNLWPVTWKDSLAVRMSLAQNYPAGLKWVLGIGVELAGSGTVLESLGNWCLLQLSALLFDLLILDKHLTRNFLFSFFFLFFIFLLIVLASLIFIKCFALLIIFINNQNTIIILICLDMSTAFLFDTL